MVGQQDEAIRKDVSIKTYSDVIGALKRDLISVHEYSCASGDLLATLKRHTDGDVSRIIGKSDEVNYKMMVFLEGMLTSLAAVEKSQDEILLATLAGHTRAPKRIPLKKAVVWLAIGVVMTLTTIGAGWVGGVRSGALVGYSRAFDDLAAGGMIAIKRHGNWVDLTMGPNNPVGRETPAKATPTMRVSADKAPDLK